MNWKKLGLIFDLKKNKLDWLKSHAMTPTPLLFQDKIRVYYSGRSENGKSMISFVDLDRNDPKKIIYINKKPLFNVGDIGMFDDSGTIVTSVVKVDSIVYLYYTAYSMSVLVPYRNSIGVAISHDGGNTFNRMFDGPILDRSIEEPFFVISPWVIKKGNDWHLWYASCDKWITIEGKPESVYHIKYASSKDGLKWIRKNESCILPLNKEEANARPTVIEEDGKFKMWFTYRGSRDFRDGLDSYRIGYAEADIHSPNNWKRKDDKVGIKPGPDEFDNLMQAYPSVIKFDDKKVIFYNGNGFGVDGFCAAISD
jgi:predicted GH43/DUF377 family glycosyl hydrolase